MQANNDIMLLELKCLVESKVGKKIDENDSIISWELDSIEFVGLIIEIENHFNISYPFEKMDREKNGNLNSLVNIIKDQRREYNE